MPEAISFKVSLTYYFPWAVVALFWEHNWPFAPPSPHVPVSKAAEAVTFCLYLLCVRDITWRLTYIFLTILLKQIYKEGIPVILIRNLGLRIIQGCWRSCSSMLWSRNQTPVLSGSFHCSALYSLSHHCSRLWPSPNQSFSPHHLSVWESFCWPPCTNGLTPSAPWVSEWPADTFLENQTRGPVHVETELLSSGKETSLSRPLTSRFCNFYLLLPVNATGNINRVVSHSLAYLY